MCFPVPEKEVFGERFLNIWFKVTPEGIQPVL
jgi:hypothetical protein